MVRPRLVAVLTAGALTLAACTGSGEPAPEAGAGTPSAAAVASPVTGTQPSPTTAPADVDGSRQARVAALELSIAELVAMPGGPPGAVVVVQIGDDRTVHVGGVADVATGAAPDVDDHMRIASVAKAFSGAAALSLVDAGTLGLDDTIGDHLPDLPAAWSAVTLRQLLSHTSGVPDFIRSEGFAPAVVASLDTAPAPEELLSFVADEPLVFEPGTEYRYSNSDNIIVGLMVAAAAGKPYEDVLAENVFGPLGLANTSLPAGIELPEPTLHGYAWAPPEPLEDVTAGLAGGWAWASGGIVSTPADLNTFIRGYVGGALFGERTRTQQQGLFQPGAHSEPPAPGFNSASLALFRYETECGVMFGHTGNTVGYTQFAAATPDGDRSATVSITLQRTQDAQEQDALVFQALQRVELAAMCLALEG